MADLPSNQSTTVTAGDNVTITFTETEGAYWDIEIASTASGSGGFGAISEPVNLLDGGAIDIPLGVTVTIDLPDEADWTEQDTGELDDTGYYPEPPAALDEEAVSE